MDSIPPNNDRNRDGDGSPPPGKGENNDGRGGDRAREVDLIGDDLRDSGAVMMFLMVGLASWLLRNYCTC